MWCEEWERLQLQREARTHATVEEKNEIKIGEDGR